MKATVKKVLVNRNSQIRSGWKIVIMLVVYVITALMMTGLAGAVYAIYSRVIGKSSLGILQGITIGLNGDPVFSVIRTLFVTFGAISSVIIVWRFLDKKPASELGFTSYKPGVERLLAGLAAGAVSMSLVFTILLISGNVSLIGSLSSPNISPALLSGLIAFIGVGIAEEAFSRGYCMAVLKQTGSIPVMILVSSAIFSLLHLGNSNVSLTGLINIFLVGILLSLMFIRTGSLWMPIGFHTTWNYFQGSVFGLEVSGSGQTGMYITKLTSENLINGGAFGPEGGLVVTFVIVAGIVLECFFSKKFHSCIAIYNTKKI